jgi:hypothetical protein
MKNKLLVISILLIIIIIIVSYYWLSKEESLIEPYVNNNAEFHIRNLNEDGTVNPKLDSSNKLEQLRLSTFFGNINNNCYVYIPEGVTEINGFFKDGEFSNSKPPIASIYLPSTLKKIGMNEFKDYTKLTHINNYDNVFEPGIEEIGANAFRNTAIQHVKLPAENNRLNKDLWNHTDVKDLNSWLSYRPFVIKNIYTQYTQDEAFFKDNWTIVYNNKYYPINDVDATIKCNAMDIPGHDNTPYYTGGERDRGDECGFKLSDGWHNVYHRDGCAKRGRCCKCYQSQKVWVDIYDPNTGAKTNNGNIGTYKKTSDNQEPYWKNGSRYYGWNYANDRLLGTKVDNTTTENKYKYVANNNYIKVNKDSITSDKIREIRKAYQNNKFPFEDSVTIDYYSNGDPGSNSHTLFLENRQNGNYLAPNLSSHIQTIEKYITDTENIQIATYHNLEDVYNIDFNGILSKLAIANSFGDYYGFEIVYIKDKVTSLEASLFENNSYLETIIISPSVKYIKDKCFKSCTNLKRVLFYPVSQLISIGNNAFQGCNNLNTIHLPDSLQTIGYKAFQGCSYLQVYINPSSKLKVVAMDAFDKTISKLVLPAQTHFSPPYNENVLQYGINGYMGGAVSSNSIDSQLSNRYISQTKLMTVSKDKYGNDMPNSGDWEKKTINYKDTNEPWYFFYFYPPKIDNDNIDWSKGDSASSAIRSQLEAYRRTYAIKFVSRNGVGSINTSILIVGGGGSGGGSKTGGYGAGGGGGGEVKDLTWNIGNRSVINVGIGHGHIHEDKAGLSNGRTGWGTKINLPTSGGHSSWNAGPGYGGYAYAHSHDGRGGLSGNGNNGGSHNSGAGPGGGGSSGGGHNSWSTSSHNYGGNGGNGITWIDNQGYGGGGGGGSWYTQTNGKGVHGGGDGGRFDNPGHGRRGSGGGGGGTGARNGNYKIGNGGDGVCIFAFNKYKFDQGDWVFETAPIEYSLNKDGKTIDESSYNKQKTYDVYQNNLAKKFSIVNKANINENNSRHSFLTVPFPIDYYNTYNSFSSNILETQDQDILRKIQVIKDAEDIITTNIQNIRQKIGMLPVTDLINLMNNAYDMADLPSLDNFNTHIRSIDTYVSAVEEQFINVIIEQNKEKFQLELATLKDDRDELQRQINEAETTNKARIQRRLDREEYLAGSEIQRKQEINQLKQSAGKEAKTATQTWYNQYQTKYNSDKLDETIASKAGSISLYNQNVEDSIILNQLDTSLNDLDDVLGRVSDQNMSTEIERNMLDLELKNIGNETAAREKELQKLQEEDTNLKKENIKIKDRLKLTKLDQIISNNNMDLKHVNDTIKQQRLFTDNVKDLVQDKKNKLNILGHAYNTSDNVIQSQQQLIDNNIKTQEKYQIEKFTNLNKYNMKYMDPKYEDYRLNQEDCDQLLNEFDSDKYCEQEYYNINKDKCISKEICENRNNNNELENEMYNNPGTGKRFKDNKDNYHYNYTNTINMSLGILTLFTIIYKIK